jgi:hypothetical protein
MTAGYARRHMFGFYMDHFFLGVPLAHARACLYRLVMMDEDRLI